MKLVELDEQPLQKELKFDSDFMFNFITVKKAMTVIPQHVHPFAHTTQLPCGAVRLWRESGIEGPSEDYKAPDLIVVKAGTKHTFMTLEDNTVLVCTTRLDENGHAHLLEEHQLERTG